MHDLKGEKAAELKAAIEDGMPCARHLRRISDAGPVLQDLGRQAV